MKLSFVFFLLLCDMAVGQIREYVLASKPLTYCRVNYVDLATITTNEVNQRLMKVSAGVSVLFGWIGLNRNALDSHIWQWSDGESMSFSNWISSQPDNYRGNESCVILTLFGWNDVVCTFAFPFYCSWRFVLVNDSKTWEEAHEYCRTYYTGLASPISRAQLYLAANALTQSQTVSVWTGLHFVNRQWISVSRSSLVSLISLPSCPSRHYRCGALNTKTNIWENRDCSEKLNFLCY